MTLPACTVVLPVHNGGSRLAGCLESLAQQSRSDFEIVAREEIGAFLDEAGYGHGTEYLLVG